MAKNDKDVPTYYLDACVLIDLIENDEHHELAKPLVAVIEDAIKGRFDLVTSTLTIAEVWKAKCELDRQAVDPIIEKKISNLWHPVSSPIRLVEVHELIARDSLQLLRGAISRGWSKTKGNDAIHLVTAHREGASEFFSTETAMKKWEEFFGFKVKSPHYEASPESLDSSPTLFNGMMPQPEEVVDIDVYWIWQQSKNRHLLERAAGHFGSQRSLRKGD